MTQNNLPTMLPIDNLLVTKNLSFTAKWRFPPLKVKFETTSYTDPRRFNSSMCRATAR